ncbi:IS30 family transposase [Levilactobacillus brevis]|uniref:IS30 family transposase n=1 Tax=Levilactobacillus yiduensis TaxID=2953880 RepID=UPI000EF31EB8|nr:IS30 family transposase [Levilactobacillus brevis]
MQEQLTMNRPKGHHLTLKERGNIEVYFNHDGYSRRKIADLIGVSPQTINNEIKRGLVTNKQRINGKEKYYEVYVAEAAERRYHEKRVACHRPYKFAQSLDFLAFFVERFKTDDWAPDTVVGRAKALGLFRPEEMVCTQTLYKYIDEQLLEVCNLDLAEKLSRRPPKHVTTVHKYRRLLGQSIEERPAEVDSRETFGHFEIDTIVGKRDGQESVILTLIERQTRFQIIRLIDGRNADSVAYAMQSIIAEYGPIIKSITADNGPEFTTLTQVMASVAPVYFTHPYTSSERGSNEVHNRMVRRDFPKGTSLDAISPADVAETADKLNNLPRRQLGFQTPAERFANACG